MTYFRSDKMVNKILIAYPINYSSIILGISFKMGSELDFYFKAKKLLEDFDNQIKSEVLFSVFTPPPELV